MYRIFGGCLSACVFLGLFLLALPCYVNGDDVFYPICNAKTDWNDPPRIQLQKHSGEKWGVIDKHGKIVVEPTLQLQDQVSCCPFIGIGKCCPVV